MSISEFSQLAKLGNGGDHIEAVQLEDVVEYRVNNGFLSSNIGRITIAIVAPDSTQDGDKGAEGVGEEQRTTV
jgi:hypothetical protein